VSDPCSGSNITLFAIGGNGILSPQDVQFFSQGRNPIRIFADTTGTFLYVLDHDSPDNFAPSYNPLTNGCTLALGVGVQTCGDITAFSINSNTGRLTLVQNAQVTSASGAALSYFPVPANPIDFVLASTFVETVSGTPTTGDTVFPYTYASSTGQLTINSNSAQPLNVGGATEIVSANSFVYVLDNEPLTYIPVNETAQVTVPSQILPFTVGTAGALQETGGVVPGDPNLENPIYLIAESTNKFVYVAYQGNNNTSTTAADSGIAGWVIDTATRELTPEISGSPFGTGAGPVCLVEDPSNQFVYTANFLDSTVTGSSIDVQAGVLAQLPGTANKSYPLRGPASWCIVTGRTS
jgi:hypothetical protein